MPTLYVAFSKVLGQWASDVGLSKHVFKIGVTEDDPKTLVAAGWAAETDWLLVKQQAVDDLSEEEAIRRVALRAKRIEPRLYPKLRGAEGVFKVVPAQVESRRLVQRALAGEAERVVTKLKPADFADYLIQSAVK